MTKIPPSDAAGVSEARLRDLERRLANLETSRRAPFTEIVDDDGNRLLKLSSDGLQFFDTGGNVISDFDADGLHVLDASGNEITTIDDLGLTVANAAGVPQLRAGNLDGAGDFGVEIGGGRARAMDITTLDVAAGNVMLTTTRQSFAAAVITPPSWATDVLVWGLIFVQMTNVSGGDQALWFRSAITGDLETVSDLTWTEDIPAGKVRTVSDTLSRVLVRGTHFNNTITAVTRSGVTIGANAANFVRTRPLAFMLR